MISRRIRDPWLCRRPTWWSNSLIVLAGLEASQVRRIAEPADGPPQALLPGQPGSPSGALAELRGVADQPHHLGLLRAQPLSVLDDIGLRAHQRRDLFG